MNITRWYKVIEKATREEVAKLQGMYHHAKTLLDGNPYQFDDYCMEEDNVYTVAAGVIMAEYRKLFAVIDNRAP